MPVVPTHLIAVVSTHQVVQKPSAGVVLTAKAPPLRLHGSRYFSGTSTTSRNNSQGELTAQGEQHKISFSYPQFLEDDVALFSPMIEANPAVLRCVSQNSAMTPYQRGLERISQRLRVGNRSTHDSIHPACDILPSQAQSTFNSMWSRI